MQISTPSRASWRVFGILMTGALVGIVGILPYSLTLLGTLPSSVVAELPPLWILLTLQIVQSLVLIGLATALGLWLGAKVGLGAPLLYGLVGGDRDARTQLRALIRPSVLLGLLAAGVIMLLDIVVFTTLLPAATGPNPAVQPPAWQGLLASFYGAIPEELLLRLGLMTFFVWIGARLTRVAVPGPGPVVMWTAIVLAALLFGVGHLPATAAIFPLTPVVIVRALLLNGLGGIVFGWLYWRQGLPAAMLAHFSADIVLHVAAPLLNR